MGALARPAVVGLALLLAAVAGNPPCLAADPAAAPDPWRDPETWRRTVEDLRGLEVSTDLEQARARYVELLEAIGQAAARESVPMADEAALRDFYQRAIGLEPGAHAEGMLLLRLAESWSRTGPGSGDNWRRIESLLLRAADLLTEPSARVLVHSRLGQLYRQTSGDGNLTRAALHFREVAETAQADQALRAAAQEALAELTREELTVAVEHRFLPGTQVGVVARTRNLGELRVQLAPLALPEAGPPVACGGRSIDWTAAGLAPGGLLLDEVQPVASRDLSDWKETEIRLGESLPSGWYAVRLEGGSIVSENFVLVTSLEMVALPDASGGLAVWAGDCESAGPAAGALLWVLGEGGEVLHQAVLDQSGMAVLEPARTAGWRELHVVAGRDTGCLCSGDIAPAAAAPAWAVANAAEAAPGGTLQWCVFGGGAADTFTFRLPDGAAVQSAASRRGAQWAAGELPIPATLQVPGPVMLDAGSGVLLNLAHVRTSRLLPLGLVFSGDRMSAGHNLFHGAKPVAARVIPAFAARPSLPEYVRLRVGGLQRAPVIAAGDPPAAALPPVLEVILPLEEAMGNGAVLALPARAGAPDLQAYRVEVLSLEQGTLLAEGCLAVSAYRGYVELRQAERIIRPGGTVVVTAAPPGAVDLPEQPLEGELVVFRETWESRYIHRKRGTAISEQEYLGLPDRSLLGAARTDYRLAEQGYRSEETARLPVQVGGAPAQVTVPFERPGYYRIELQTRDADVRAVLPGGPLEVWVVGGPQDMRWFRSDRPRLLVEPQGQGGHEVLALLPNPGASVVVGAGYADGHVAASHHNCPDAALFLELPSAAAALESVRVVAVGDRKTLCLFKHPARPGNGSWRLGSEVTFGLNPGIAFDWPVEAPAEFAAQPVFWTFYSAQDAAAVSQRLAWQHARHEGARAHADGEVLSLSLRLPVQHPLAELESAPAAAAAAGTEPQADLGGFLALHPELRQSPAALAAPSPLVEPLREPGSPLMRVRGVFPATAGKWQLAVFALDGQGNLQTTEWLVSTELPVRAAFSGPAQARPGDQLVLNLAVENTTREPVRLDVQVEAGGSLVAGNGFPGQMPLQPGERAVAAIPAAAAVAGSGRVQARLSWDGQQTEAQHAVEVQAPGVATGLRLRMARPQQEMWEQTLMLGDFAGAEVVLASGMGTLLPEIWPALRSAHQDFEPLLVALGDWAVARALSHHGMAPSAAVSEPAAVLAQALRQHEGPEGGWSWRPGRPANAWLSALVLGTLETFSAPGEVLSPEMRERARAFLEGELAGGDCPLTTQLLALDAVLANPESGGEARPTRIQARAFLELFHDRANLASYQVAMLLKIARSFDFREEMAILDDELQGRIAMGMPLAASSFWRLSQVYLSQVQAGKPRAVLDPILAQALGQLETAGPDGGWQAISGFLNLLAAFLLEGDFSSEGVARVTLGGQPFDFPLNPADAGGGRHKALLDAGQLAGGTLQVRIGMQDAASAVFLAVIGTLKAAPEPRPWPGLTETRLREFEQQTLLAGPQRQVEALPQNGLLTLRPGDLLQVRIAFENTGQADHAELLFPVPACTSPEESSLRHSVATGENAETVALPPPAPARRGALDQLLRLDSFPVGEHRIDWSMTVLWEGEYAMPAPVIYLPMNGQRFALAKPVRLRVAP